MAQRLARRAEDREVPGSSPTNTNFSIVFMLPVIKINWGVEPHQNRPSKSRILAGYQILDFISQVDQSPSELSIHGYWSKFLVTVTRCPSWRQLAADNPNKTIESETSSAAVEFPPLYLNNIFYVCLLLNKMNLILKFRSFTRTSIRESLVYSKRIHRQHWTCTR